MDNEMEWEWCACDWVDGNPEQPCGGCERQCRLYRDDVLHWQGTHWHPVCALGHAITRIKDQERRIEELEKHNREMRLALLDDIARESQELGLYDEE